MSNNKTISDYVSELNQVFSMILENPETPKNWEALQKLIKDLREDSYDVLQSPISEITVNEPGFFANIEISELNKLYCEVHEKKLLYVKRQNFETAASYRDSEKVYGRKLLEMYKKYKGEKFGHFIESGEKIIIYISTWRGEVESRVREMLNDNS